MISKEQEEDFKRRKASGKIVSDAERSAFEATRPKLDKKDYLKFLKSTDEKLK